jgi:hypothetical protein
VSGLVARRGTASALTGLAKVFQRFNLIAALAAREQLSAVRAQFRQLLDTVPTIARVHLLGVQPSGATQRPPASGVPINLYDFKPAEQNKFRVKRLIRPLATRSQLTLECCASHPRTAAFPFSRSTNGREACTVRGALSTRVRAVPA